MWHIMALEPATPMIWKAIPLIYLALNAILVIEFFSEGGYKGAKWNEIVLVVLFLLCVGSTLLVYIGLRKMVRIFKGGDTSKKGETHGS